MVGVLVGDAGMFLLGHHFGTHILQWKPIALLMPPRRYGKMQAQFERYGNRMLFLARFLPGMRTAIYTTAGASHRVGFWRFLLLDGAAALISVPIWVYLGYFGANRRDWLGMWIRRGQNSLWLIAGVFLLVALLLWWRQRRKRDDPA
jgi:LPXTG-motif cell wall-anchored protein